MQQDTLDYRRPSLQTFRWRRDYRRVDWETALGTTDGDEIVLRRDPRARVVRAQHHDKQWSLDVRRRTIQVFRPGEAQPIAVLRRRWFSATEIRFADGRVARIDPVRSFQFTLTEQVRFVERRQLLLTMRPSFWSVGGKQISIETTNAGAEFPGRTILTVLGFHELVVADMAD